MITYTCPYCGHMWNSEQRPDEISGPRCPACGIAPPTDAERLNVMLMLADAMIWLRNAIRAGLLPQEGEKYIDQLAGIIGTLKKSDQD